VDNRIFFAGLVILIFGLLILVYDLPQIMYIQSLTSEELRMVDRAEHDKFQRIQVEFYAGIGILAAGATVVLFARFPPGVLAKK